MTATCEAAAPTPRPSRIRLMAQDGCSGAQPPPGTSDSQERGQGRRTLPKDHTRQLLLASRMASRAARELGKCLYLNDFVAS